MSGGVDRLRIDYPLTLRHAEDLITNDVSLELSLTVPIVNTLAFVFTVLGDWYVDGKVISKGKSRSLNPRYQTNGRFRYRCWDGSNVGRNWLVCSK